MKKIEPSVSLDHMLRQTRMHHVQLSSMVDLKANLLLTIASVVLTMAAPHIINPNLKVAVIVLILFCLSTIFLAIYAVMPKMPLTIKREVRSDIKSPFFNLLFFGDFVNLEYEDYEREMVTMMNDTDEIYRAEVKELYQLGMFLATKKYRYLQLAYLSFIAGLVACCIVVLFMHV